MCIIGFLSDLVDLRLWVAFWTSYIIRSEDSNNIGRAHLSAHGQRLAELHHDVVGKLYPLCPCNQALIGCRLHIKPCTHENRRPFDEIRYSDRI